MWFDTTNSLSLSANLLYSTFHAGQVSRSLICITESEKSICNQKRRAKDWRFLLLPQIDSLVLIALCVQPAGFFSAILIM
jgi:hypothetical protein